MDAATVLLCLVGLQAKHFLADFCLQTPIMLAGKGRYGHPGGLIHAAVHAALTALVLWVFVPDGAAILGLTAAEALVHYHVDWLKERLAREAEPAPSDRAYWCLHGADQFLHQVTLVAVAWIAFL